MGDLGDARIDSMSGDLSVWQAWGGPAASMAIEHLSLSNYLVSNGPQQLAEITSETRMIDDWSLDLAPASMFELNDIGAPDLVLSNEPSGLFDAVPVFDAGIHAIAPSMMDALLTLEATGMAQDAMLEGQGGQFGMLPDVGHLVGELYEAQGVDAIIDALAGNPVGPVSFNAIMNSSESGLLDQAPDFGPMSMTPFETFDAADDAAALAAAQG